MSDKAGEIAANLQRADVSLKAARVMIEKGYFDIAASRAYYAAFHAASALLLKENIDTSKHSGVIVAIHRYFVKEGKLSQEQGKKLELAIRTSRRRRLWSFRARFFGRSQ